MGSLLQQSRHAPTDPEGPTGKLCTWIDSMSLGQVPEDIVTRAKFLILDGLACAVVGAHLPWSETAVHAVLEMEPKGQSSIFGWDRVSMTQVLLG